MDFSSFWIQLYMVAYSIQIKELGEAISARLQSTGKMAVENGELKKQLTALREELVTALTDKENKIEQLEKRLDVHRQSKVEKLPITSQVQSTFFVAVSLASISSIAMEASASLASSDNSGSLSVAAAGYTQ